jgi:hypothetical protein
MKIICLDSLFATSRVDFIKMDIQGSELLALKGLSKTIANNPRLRMMLEFSPLCLTQANADPRDLLPSSDRLGLRWRSCTRIARRKKLPSTG